MSASWQCTPAAAGQRQLHFIEPGGWEGGHLSLLAQRRPGACLLSEPRLCCECLCRTHGLARTCACLHARAHVARCWQACPS